jgi:hypothetical protein
VPLALALLTETLQLSQSADVELVNDNQRESADEMTNVDSRRDWLTPKEPIALTSDWTIASQADDEKRSDSTSDELAGLLDLLARDHQADGRLIDL